LIATSTGGIVGGGVYELVKKCIESGRLGSVGASIEVAKICVRSLDKPRDFELKAGTVLVTDYEEILADESINCVVELMGGVTR
jgi:homoserine dehydrogenase